MSTPVGYSASGGQGGSAGPSTASAATYGSGLDGSGWVVNFSGVQNASAAYDKSGGGVPGVGGGSSVLASVPQGAWLALGALALALVGAAAWRSRA